MSTRRTFLGRAGAAFALLFVEGPRKLLAIIPEAPVVASNSHINAALAEISIKYMHSTDSFVASRVFPEMPVDLDSQDQND